MLTVRGAVPGRCRRAHVDDAPRAAAPHVTRTAHSRPGDGARCPRGGRAGGRRGAARPGAARCTGRRYRVGDRTRRAAAPQRMLRHAMGVGALAGGVAALAVVALAVGAVTVVVGTRLAATNVTGRDATTAAARRGPRPGRPARSPSRP